MSEITLVPGKVIGTTGRSTTNNTQQFSNPNSMLTDDTALSFWGVKNPLKTSSIYTSYPNAIGGRNGTYFKPEVITLSNFTSSSTIDEDIIISSLNFKYKYGKISYSSESAHGEFDAPTITLLLNNNKIKIIKGNKPPAVGTKENNSNSMDLKTVFTNVFDVSDLELTGKDIPNLKIQFDIPQNTTTNHCRIVVQYMSIDISYDSQALYQVSSSISKSSLNTDDNFIYHAQVLGNASTLQSNNIKATGYKTCSCDSCIDSIEAVTNEYRNECPYCKTKGNLKYTIQKDTFIETYINPPTLNTGDTGIIIATIRDVNYNFVNEGLAQIYIDDVLLTTTSTVENGIARFSYIFTNNADNTDKLVRIRVKFLGTKNYKYSLSDTTYATVTNNKEIKKDIKISYNLPSGIEFEQGTVLSCRFIDAISHEPLSKINAVFNISRVKGKVDKDYTVETDENGEASLPIGLSGGNYQFFIRFDGNELYNANMSKKLTYKVVELEKPKEKPASGTTTSGTTTSGTTTTSETTTTDDDEEDIKKQQLSFQTNVKNYTTVNKGTDITCKVTNGTTGGEEEGSLLPDKNINIKITNLLSSKSKVYNYENTSSLKTNNTGVAKITINLTPGFYSYQCYFNTKDPKYTKKYSIPNMFYVCAPISDISNGVIVCDTCGAPYCIKCGGNIKYDVLSQKTIKTSIAECSIIDSSNTTYTYDIISNPKVTKGTTTNNIEAQFNNETNITNLIKSINYTNEVAVNSSTVDTSIDNSAIDSEISTTTTEIEETRIIDDKATELIINYYIEDDYVYFVPELFFYKQTVSNIGNGEIITINISGPVNQTLYVKVTCDDSGKYSITNLNLCYIDAKLGKYTINGVYNGAPTYNSSNFSTEFEIYTTNSKKTYCDKYRLSKDLEYYYLPTYVTFTFPTNVQFSTPTLAYGNATKNTFIDLGNNQYRWNITELNTNTGTFEYSDNIETISQPLFKNRAKIFFNMKATNVGAGNITAVLDKTYASDKYNSDIKYLSINKVNKNYHLNINTSYSVATVGDTEPISFTITYTSNYEPTTDTFLKIKHPGLNIIWDGDNIPITENEYDKISIHGTSLSLKGTIPATKSGEFDISVQKSDIDSSTVTKHITILEKSPSKENFEITVEDGTSVEYDHMIFTQGDDLEIPVTYSVSDLTENPIDDISITGHDIQIPINEKKYVVFDVSIPENNGKTYNNLLFEININSDDAKDYSYIITGCDNNTEIINNKYIALKSINSGETKQIRIAVLSDKEINKEVGLTTSLLLYGTNINSKGEIFSKGAKIIIKDLPSLQLSIVSSDKELYFDEGVKNLLTKFNYIETLELDIPDLIVNSSSETNTSVDFVLKNTNYTDGTISYYFDEDTDKYNSIVTNNLFTINFLKSYWFDTDILRNTHKLYIEYNNKTYEYEFTVKLIPKNLTENNNKLSYLDYTVTDNQSYETKKLVLTIPNIGSTFISNNIIYRLDKDENNISSKIDNGNLLLYLPVTTSVDDIHNIYYYFIDNLGNIIYSIKNFNLTYKVSNKSKIDAKNVKIKLNEAKYFNRMSYTLGKNQTLDGDVWNIGDLPANSAEQTLTVNYNATKKGYYQFIMELIDDENNQEDNVNINQFIYNLNVEIYSDTKLYTDVSNNNPYINDLINYKITVSNKTKTRNKINIKIRDIGNFISQNSSKTYEIISYENNYGLFKQDLNPINNILGTWTTDVLGIDKDYVLNLTLKPNTEGIHALQAHFVEDNVDVNTKVEVLNRKDNVDFDVYQAIDVKDKDDDNITTCIDYENYVQICDDDFISIGEYFAYIFTVKNNSKKTLSNLTVKAFVPKEFMNIDDDINDRFICSSYNGIIINKTENILSFPLNNILSNTTKTFCIKFKATVPGEYYSLFTLTGNSLDVKTKILKAKINSIYPENRLEHQLYVYNFENSNKYYHYDVINNELKKVFQRKDRTSRLVDSEDFNVNAIESFKGNNLKELYHNIKENSKYINPTLFRTGSNAFAEETYNLYSDGLIRRFGLLKSEVFHNTGTLPHIQPMTDFTMIWDKDNWSSKAWAGDIWDNGVFNLSVDYSNVPSNFKLLSINELQSIIDKTRVYGTKGIASYYDTEKLKLKTFVSLKNIEIGSHSKIKLKLNPNIGSITEYNNNDIINCNYNTNFVSLNKPLISLPKTIYKYKCENCITNGKSGIHIGNYNACPVCGTSFKDSNVEVSNVITYGEKDSNKTQLKAPKLSVSGWTLQDTYKYKTIQDYNQLFEFNNFNDFDITKIVDNYLKNTKTVINNNIETEVSEEISQIITLNDTYEYNLSNYTNTFDFINNKEKPIQLIEDEYQIILSFNKDIEDNTEFGVYLSNDVDENYLKISRIKDLTFQKNGFQIKLNDKILNTIYLTEHIYNYKIIIQKSNKNYLHFYYCINTTNKKDECIHFGYYNDKHNDLNNLRFYVLKNKTTISTYYKCNMLNLQWNGYFIDNKFMNKNITDKTIKEINFPDSKVSLKLNTNSFETISQLDDIYPLNDDIEWNYLDNINENNTSYAICHNKTDNVAYSTPLLLIFDNIDIEDYDEIEDISLLLKTQSNKENFTKINTNIILNGNSYIPKEQGNYIAYPQAVENVHEQYYYSINIEEKYAFKCNECEKEFRGLYFKCPYCGSTDISDISLDFISNKYKNNTYKLYDMYHKYDFNSIVFNTQKTKFNAVNINVPITGTVNLNNLSEFDLLIKGTNYQDYKYFYCPACQKAGLGNYDTCPYCTSDEVENYIGKNLVTSKNIEYDTGLKFDIYLKEKNRVKVYAVNQSINSVGNFTKTLNLLNLLNTSSSNFTIEIFIENQFKKDIENIINNFDTTDTYKNKILTSINDVNLKINDIHTFSSYNDEINWSNINSLLDKNNNATSYTIPYNKTTSEELHLYNFNIPNYLTKANGMNLIINGINESDYEADIIIKNSNLEEIKTTVPSGLFTATFDLLKIYSFTDIENIDFNLFLDNIQSKSTFKINDIHLNISFDKKLNTIPSLDSVQNLDITSNSNWTLYSTNNLWGLNQELPHKICGYNINNRIIVPIDFKTLNSNEYIYLYNANLIIKYKNNHGTFTTNILELPNTYETGQLITGNITQYNENNQTTTNNDTYLFGNVEFDDRMLKNDTEDKLDINGEIWNSINLKDTVYQSFIAENDNITAIELNKFGKIGYPYPYITLSLYDDNLKQPDNLITSRTINGWDFDDNGLEKFDFIVNNLNVGETYWIGLSVPSYDEYNYYKIKYNDDYHGNLIIKNNNENINTNETISLSFNLYSGTNHHFYNKLPADINADDNIRVKNTFYRKNVNTNIGIDNLSILYGEEQCQNYNVQVGVSNIKGYVDKEITLKTKLFASSTLNRGEVEFSINNIVIGSAPVINNEASLQCNLVSINNTNQSSGTGNFKCETGKDYQIKATFTGYKKYSRTEGYGALHVYDAQTPTISMSINDSIIFNKNSIPQTGFNFNFTDTFNLKCYTKLFNNDIVESGQINIIINDNDDKILYNKVNDVINGLSEFNIPLTKSFNPTKSYFIQISYIGNNKYNGTNFGKSIPLVIHKANPYLLISPLNDNIFEAYALNKQPINTYLIGTVLNGEEDNEKISNEKIYYTLSYDVDATSSYSNVNKTYVMNTDSKGYTSLMTALNSSINNPGQVNYKVKILFKGNDYYNSVEKNIKLNIKQLPGYLNSTHNQENITISLTNDFGDNRGMDGQQCNLYNVDTNDNIINNKAIAIGTFDSHGICVFNFSQINVSGSTSNIYRIELNHNQGNYSCNDKIRFQWSGTSWV